MHTLTIDIGWALTLLLVIARVAGVLLVAPVFAEPVVPVKVRLLLAVAIAFAVAGRLTQPPHVPTGGLGLGLALIFEAAVGAAIGFTARLVFAGVELGAMYVGQQMGIGLAELYDPQTEDTSGAVKLLGLLALVIFLAIGGHRALLSGAMSSFEAVPVSGSAPVHALPGMLASVLMVSFSLALKVAAPVLVAMLLATVAMGLLQRTAPQFHIFSTGMPVRVMVGLVMLAGTLGVMVTLIDSAWSMVMERVQDALVQGP